jgi:hypothetical protein
LIQINTTLTAPARMPVTEIEQTQRRAGADFSPLSKVRLLVRKLPDFDDPPSAVAKPPFSAHSSEDFVRRFQISFYATIAISNMNTKNSH